MKADKVFNKKEYWLNYYDLMTDYEKENNKIRVVEDAFMCGYDSRNDELTQKQNDIDELVDFIKGLDLSILQHQNANKLIQKHTKK